MSNRFADAIIRIVEPLIPKNTGDVDSANKVNIGAKRSVAYATSSGAVAAANNALGNTEQNLFTKEVSDAAKEALQEAALSSLGIGSAAQGSIDAQDMLDKAKKPLDPGSLIKNAATVGGQAASTYDPFSGLNSNGSIINQITGLKDLISGALFDARMDGYFLPRGDWVDAETPPVVPDYLPGYVWNAGSVFNGTTSDFARGQSPRLSADLYAGLLNASPSFPDIEKPYFVVAMDPIPPDTPFPGGIRHYITYGRATGGNFQGATTGSPCPGNTPEEAAICLLDPPRETAWPTAGKGQLTRVRVSDDNTLVGQWLYSQFDTEIPIAFKGPRSKIVAVTTVGTPVEIVTLRNGGWAFYETSGGSPTGDVQVFNYDNSFVGYRTPAELTNLLP